MILFSYNNPETENIALKKIRLRNKTLEKINKKNDLIWLLLAGDLCVSNRESLFCFLFTGSEKTNETHPKGKIIH